MVTKKTVARPVNIWISDKKINTSHSGGNLRSEISHQVNMAEFIQFINSGTKFFSYNTYAGFGHLNLKNTSLFMSGYNSLIASESTSLSASTSLIRSLSTSTSDFARSLSASTSGSLSDSTSRSRSGSLSDSVSTSTSDSALTSDSEYPSVSASESQDSNSSSLSDSQSISTSDSLSDSVSDPVSTSLSESTSISDSESESVRISESMLEKYNKSEDIIGSEHLLRSGNSQGTSSVNGKSGLGLLPVTGERDRLGLGLLRMGIASALGLSTRRKNNKSDN